MNSRRRETGTVDAMDYLPRLVEPYLADLLTALPAVVVEGPKAVGKTATARRLAKSVIALDDEAERQAMRDDRERITRLAPPLLIDEWQYYPPVWDRVRRSVDEDYSPGRFILAGSATPIKAPKHSGAGRIVHVRMRPLSLAERQLGESAVSLGTVLAGETPAIAGTTPVKIADYAEEIVKGGLPSLRLVGERFRRVAWNGYLAEVLDRDIEELGMTVRRPATLRAWLRSYAGATSTTASYVDILDNATPADTDKPSKTTTLAWREILGRMWLLDPLDAWEDQLGCVTKLAKAPKHHLADPALAAHLLGVTASTLLATPNADGAPFGRSGTLFGALFESLVAMSVRVYAEVAGATVSHLRTRGGDHEVDLIVTRDDGKIVAIEVKSSPDIHDDDVKHLRWLKNMMSVNLVDALVVTTGNAAYRRSSDGIAVVPAVLLGA